MQGPVAVFGITPQDFTEKVFTLRKRIRDLGYEELPEELLTVPHLTLAWKKDFDFSKAGEIQELVAEAIEDFQPFTLEIGSFEIMDQNIAVKFDNSFSKELAQKVSDKLKGLGFELVVTDHMKLIRSKIKQEHLEKVRQMVAESSPQRVEIVGVASAGKFIRKEEFLWGIPLY